MDAKLALVLKEKRGKYSWNRNTKSGNGLQHSQQKKIQP